MADKHDAGDDDAGWWNCSLCTYKNSSDRFVCEMCDLKRGTSTRKPRCSTDTIVAQVVKQQEQIRQQTKAKPSPKNKTTGPSISAGAQATGAAAAPTDAPSRSKKQGASRTSTPSVSADSKSETSQDPTQKDKPVSTKAPFRNSPGSNKRSSSARPNTSSTMVKQMRAEERTRKREKIRRRENGDSDSDTSDLSSSCSSSSSSRSDTSTDTSDDSTSDDSTDSEHEPEIPSQEAKIKPAKKERPVTANVSLDNSSQYSSSPAMTPEPTTSSPSNPDSKQSSLHPFKIRPVEINGNLIKYSPPTSSGRTGLIIDKKRFTQHSVTVNDVTITFTEFATRQNKYVRKKKKKRSGRTVAPPASISPATATVANKSGND